MAPTLPPPRVVAEEHQDYANYWAPFSQYSEAVEAARPDDLELAEAKKPIEREFNS